MRRCNDIHQFTDSPDTNSAVEMTLNLSFTFDLGSVPLFSPIGNVSVLLAVLGVTGRRTKRPSVAHGVNAL